MKKAKDIAREVFEAPWSARAICDEDGFDHFLGHVEAIVQKALEEAYEEGVRSCAGDYECSWCGCRCGYCGHGGD